MNKKRKFYLLLFAIVLCFSCFLTCFATTIQSVVYAQSVSLDTFNSYTNVMDDLKVDPTFDETQFPANESDYSLQVLQVAESSANELFVYVYQPCGSFHDVYASSINISRTIYENLHYENYTLSLINSYGVFFKYKVDNFEILPDLVRYYDISSILRPYIDGVDEETGNDNTINEMAFEVAKRFTATTSNGQVSYSNIQTEVITITDKFVGMLRYTEGYNLVTWDKVDRHFVAFSTDWNIEQLYEADLSFVTKDYQITSIAILPFDILNWDVAKSYSNEQTHNITVTHTQHTSTDNYFGIGNFTWNRIESAEDFLNNNSDLSDSTKENVGNKQWVLSFYETEWWKYDHMAVPTQGGTEVSEVMILRLKFETDGVEYNLGVVDNKTTGSNIPLNKNTTQDMFRTLFAIVLIILLVVVLAPILPTIFTILWAIVKILFKVIIWVISAPFKLIKAIFKKRE